MSQNDRIEGGYYIKARCVQESSIAHAPPHVREIWDWLLMHASHRLEKRGKVFCSYERIKEDLHWMVGFRKMAYKRHQYENAMKWLMKAGMIAVTKAVRGSVVEVLKYAKYQDPKNYESRNDCRNESRPYAGHVPDEIQEGEELKNKRIKELNTNTSRKFSEESEAYRLSVLLFEKIKELDPKAKMPDFQKWSEHMDKLMRLDSRTYEEIEVLILWISQDSFWSKNILSTKKLREKFSQLWINAKAAYAKSKPSYSVID